jgi:iron complex transport system ATP-binding protein
MKATTKQPLIIKDLGVRYAKRSILSDVTLTPLAPGQVVGLLGPNAAGKSTFLKALVGQVPYQGSAAVGSRELSEFNHRERCSLIAYAPQTPPHPSDLLVYEFVLSVLKTVQPQLADIEAEGRIQEAFDRLGLSEIAVRPVSELSGGKRQLLGLSQVLARRSDLIFLDEPTSALDLRWKVEALAVMRETALARNALVLIALHDLNLALRFCDRLILLGNGGVLAEGPAESTLDPEMLRMAYGVEARLETCSKGRAIVVVEGAAEPVMHNLNTPTLCT